MPRANDLLERRIHDLLELAQNACEFYLLSPAKNARSVFILVDDLCELVIKSQLEDAAKQRQNEFKKLIHQNDFLQGDAHKVLFNHFLRREITERQFRADVGASSTTRKADLDSYIAQCGGNPQDWSEDKGEGFKDFAEVAKEVKDLRPTEATLHQLLDEIIGRRTTRNRLFHDQRQAGLTVSEDKCLDALLALFQLCELLWGQTFKDAARSNVVVRAQLAALCFKQKAKTRRTLLNVYDNLVNKQRKPKNNKSSTGYDCLVLQDDATTFFNRLKGVCENEVAQGRNKITRLQTKQPPPPDLNSQISQLEEHIQIYEELLRDCFGVEPPPNA